MKAVALDGIRRQLPIRRHSQSAFSMKHNIAAGIAIVTLSSGCVSGEGNYSPGCIAFEGSEVQLRDGKFTWEIFTDQVEVDSDGNVINQFPGYPKQGSYRIDRKVVELETNDGESLPRMYLHRDGYSLLLLTGQQQAEWQKSGNFE